MSAGWRFPHCPVGPDWALDWGAIDARFGAWLAPLRDCPQDPIHHAEGDVYTHTRLVCEALVASTAWRALDERTRSIVFAATLLHDIAKPPCTQVGDDGRVSSPGHAKKGAAAARRMLYTDGALDADRPPFDERESIVGLVRYHGLPLFVLERDDPERTVIEASQTARLDHAAVLAEADVRGRTCDDQKDLFERIELFRELIDGAACADRPRQFASDHTRFLYFRGGDRLPDVEAYDDTKTEVVVMSGLPGAGKDTWIRANADALPSVSLDAIRDEMGIAPDDNQGPVARAADERAREHLRAGHGFLWNATNVTRSTRRRVIDRAAAYGARIHVVYVEATWDDLVSRNRTRNEPVPERILRRLAARLEVPDHREAHAVTVVTP